MKIDLGLYLTKVKIAPFDITSMTPEQQLQKLVEVYSSHVKTFPYNNTKLRKIGLQHPVLRSSLTFFSYSELLTSNAGGYCYQTAGLLFNVLTQLGYSLRYCATYVLNGAQVNDPKILACSPTHLILVANIAGKEYLLDPGMAPWTPRYPLLITPEGEPVLQYYDEYRLYQINKDFVLERRIKGNWFTIWQTDLLAQSQQQVEADILRLERSIKTVFIRDKKTMFATITQNGRRILVWDGEKEQLQFIKQESDSYNKKVLSDCAEASQILQDELGITITIEELETYCRTFQLPKPIRPWTINFPIDNSELRMLQRNLSI